MVQHMYFNRIRILKPCRNLTSQQVSVAETYGTSYVYAQFQYAYTVEIHNYGVPMVSAREKNWKTLKKINQMKQIESKNKVQNRTINSRIKSLTEFRNKIKMRVTVKIVPSVQMLNVKSVISIN